MHYVSTTHCVMGRFVMQGEACNLLTCTGHRQALLLRFTCLLVLFVLQQPLAGKYQTVLRLYAGVIACVVGVYMDAQWRIIYYMYGRCLVLLNPASLC